LAGRGASAASPKSGPGNDQNMTTVRFGNSGAGGETKSEINRVILLHTISERNLPGRECLVDFLIPALQCAERDVEQSGQGEGNFEANVTCLQANRTHEPCLAHAGNYKAK
jgi:hypothetical protein